MDAGGWLFSLIVFGAIAWGIGRIFITPETPAGRSRVPNGVRIAFGVAALGLCLLLYKGCDRPRYDPDLDDYYNARRP